MPFSYFQTFHKAVIHYVTSSASDFLKKGPFIKNQKIFCVHTKCMNTWMVVLYKNLKNSKSLQPKSSFLLPSLRQEWIVIIHLTQGKQDRFENAQQPFRFENAQQPFNKWGMWHVCLSLFPTGKSSEDQCL